MKFVSFNINSLRAHIHQLKAIIKKHKPDVLGLQETKVDDDAFPLEEMHQLGYHAFYHGQKAHYGVALLCKQKPITTQKGLPGEEKDAQRRIIIADVKTKKGVLTVINAYFPQGERRDHPTKFSAKSKFFKKLQFYLQNNLSPKSHIIIMGDMNISPTDYDIGIGEINRKRWLNAGKCAFLPEERAWMDALKSWGLIDTYRQKNPTITDQFSWFDYRSKGFADNRGLRIDLILASSSLFVYCCETGIDYGIRGMEKSSDHAPIWAKFDFDLN
ncbi:MAG: exodeoxyribonuclease III [Candidatus Arsenophonus melophagi]|nr:exodeoxyribonuclease III [Candidatus Arsenophonus melophagi]